MIAQLWDFNYQEAIDELKSAKRNFLRMKADHQGMRDVHVLSSDRKQLKEERKREHKKMKWRKLRAVFGKKRMKSVSSVEYEVNSIIIQLSTQVEMEEAIIK